MARSAHRGFVALALVVALLPLVITNNYFYDVAILVALNAIVCVGLNLLIGYAGQISLGHAGFFASGRVRLGAARVALRLAAALLRSSPRRPAVGGVAFVVGRPILRLKGHYLAMATLGFGIIVSIVISTEDGIHGRSRRHAGAAADAARVRRAGRAHVVLAGRRLPARSRSGSRRI